MQNTLQQAFQQAVQVHQGGDFARAERAYRQLVSHQPQNPLFTHALGILLHQTNRSAEGLKFVEQAVQAMPAAPEFHRSRAMILSAMGRRDDAMGILKHAMSLRADYLPARVDMGNLLSEAGKFQEAADAFIDAIRISPNDPAIYFNLGNAFTDLKRSEQAIAAYQKAIELRPSFAEAHNNLGNVLMATGRSSEAAGYYERALQIKPDYLEAYYNLGGAKREMKEYVSSVAAYRQAIAIKPNYGEAHLNLGVTLLDMSRSVEAETEIRTAIAMLPATAEAHYNLGRVLMDQHRLEEAEVEFSRALQLRAGFAEARTMLGNCLRDQGRTDEAIARYAEAMKDDAKFVGSYNNYAGLLKDMGRLDDSIAMLKRAISVTPDDHIFHSNILFTMMFHPGFDDAAIGAESRKWDIRFARPLTAGARPHKNDRNPDRKLKIAYMSPDLREHVVGMNMLPVFQNHDKQQVELFIYSNSAKLDRIMEQSRQCADHWREIVGMSDEKVAGLIREDQIDILVDLTMHMANARLLVMARKPAPVQATFAAYPGSTGVSAIDYRLSDPYLDPVDVETRPYSEKTVQLPDSFWCYQTDAKAQVNDLPAKSNGFVTFGNLNNFCKFNTPTLDLWAQVMRQVPNSKLILITIQGDHRRAVLDEFAKRQIEPARIRFYEKRPREEYMKVYNEIDLGLDTFPYNGHTTSLDSFWMGVPVVTKLGATVAGRAGWSQLNNLKLTELCGQSDEDFVRIAVELANDQPRLSDIRAGLRARMQSSPLCDAVKFTRGIETAMRTMWKTWCAG